MKFSAVVLAGGASSRMGCDKAALILDGEPLLSHQLRTVAQLGPSEVFVSVRPGSNYGEQGTRELVDLFPDAGPLAGVERALAASADPLVLVLAVDMPAMTAEVLRDLLAGCRTNTGAVPRIAGQFEPLSAVFPKAAHRLAAEMLCTGIHAMHEFVRRCLAGELVEICDFSNSCSRFFINWNNPSEMR